MKTLIGGGSVCRERARVTLHSVGLTSRQLRPHEYAELLQYRIGLTDICKVSSGSDSAVGTRGFDVERLLAVLEKYEPNWIAFNGKKAAEGALGHGTDYGERAELLGSSSGSSSGRACAMRN